MEDTMLKYLPIEIVENILLYLNSNDIETVCIALDLQNRLSSNFWKTLCSREGFPQFHPQQKWQECFKIERNKRIGRYAEINLPCGILRHMYHNSFIMQLGSSYNVYIVEAENRYRVQQIEGDEVLFREEFIIAKRKMFVMIYAFNFHLNLYKLLKSVPEFNLELFGINRKYCVSYEPRTNCIALHILRDSASYRRVELPDDIKSVIPTENLLHFEEIFICALSVYEQYKIKVYDIKSSSWTLDLVCYASTGLANVPNVWVGPNFIGSCDVSFRTRSVHYGPFKVWDKSGTLILNKDIEPSERFYLRCFFEDNYILLTTSDHVMTIFNNQGEVVNSIHNHFLDISMSTGHLLFCLVDEPATVVAYDWISHELFYRIQLSVSFKKSVCNNCFFYCSSGLKYEKYHFFSFV